MSYSSITCILLFFFFFCWNSHLYVSVHPQLVIEVFYGFLMFLQEIGLKGKKGKLNNYSSHFWLCALPLTILSGIYEYCIPVLYWKFLHLYGGLHTVSWHRWFHCSPPPVWHKWPEKLKPKCQWLEQLILIWNFNKSITFLLYIIHLIWISLSIL